MSERPGARRARTSDRAPGDTDADLMGAVVRGDTQALTRLYERFECRAHALARRLCADPGMAEEAVQEVFLGIWRTPGRFDPDRGSVATWLLTLVHHTAVDTLRHEATRRAHVRSSDDATPGTELAHPGADRDVLAALDAAAVHHALRALPWPHRQAIVLAHYGGYTQSEIAEVAGVPVGTIKSRTYSGLRAARVTLAAADPGLVPHGG